MIFEKDKEIEALGRTHYNAKFQNDISFRIVKNNNTNWKLMVCMYSSQLGLDNSKFIEKGQCKTLAEAKDWCEEMAERFAKDTGIDKQTIETYNQNAESIAELHSSLTPNRIYELINKYFVKGKDTVDIGCGIGRDVNWLNSNGFPAVGVDASDGMIKEAKKLYPTLEFKLDYLPALNCFDYEQFSASHLKRDKDAEVDLPGFKNLEGLSRVKLIAAEDPIKRQRRKTKNLLRGSNDLSTGHKFHNLFRRQGFTDQIPLYHVALQQKQRL